jgi:hypothetical protein
MDNVKLELVHNLKYYLSYEPFEAVCRFYSRAIAPDSSWADVNIHPSYLDTSRLGDYLGHIRYSAISTQSFGRFLDYLG